MPHEETILRVLHDALGDTHSDVDELIERLVRVCRGKESPERSEQVIALGFLVCARALRESSLMQEIAVREEVQELHRLISEILESVRRTERALEFEPRARRRRREASLVEDLAPEQKRP
jgi:hypothetical protein